MPSSPKSRFLLALALGGALLAGCGKDSGSAPTESEVPLVDADIAEVPATDQLGSFQSPVSGLAFWQHPSAAHESGLFAANGAAGLFLLDFEGNQLAKIDGTFDHGVDVTYFNQGEQAVVIAWDSATDTFRAFGFDEEVPPLIELDLTGFPEKIAGNFCLGREGGQSHFLMVNQVQEDIISGNSYKIKKDGGALQATIISSQSYAPFTDCVRDDKSGETILGRPPEEVLTQNTLQYTAKNAALLKTPSLSGVHFSEEGLHLIAASSEGLFSVVKFRDSLPNQFRVSSFDTASDVESVSTIAIGYGNYGGIYRDGVIAILEGEKSGALKLAPWNAVANAFGFKTGNPVSERSLLTAEEENKAPAPTIDLDELNEPENE